MLYEVITAGDRPGGAQLRAADRRQLLQEDQLLLLRAADAQAP